MQKLKYRKKRLDKGNGSFRYLYIAGNYYNSLLQSFMPALEEIRLEIDKTKNNYAFIKGRNCAQMALEHVGYTYTYSLDIQNFFDSINETHLNSFVTDDVLRYCLIDGAPRQGLVTSPTLSNIAFAQIDMLINHTLEHINGEIKYTRYADDLIFSFNELQFKTYIEKSVSQLLKKFDFELNTKKSRLQTAKNGRRIITGIGVDYQGIHCTRKTKRKIRAAAHQENWESLTGLYQWSRCKLPRIKD